VARGERLPKLQDEIHITGHALEARLYAEDADHGFMPSIGTLSRLRFPAGKHNLRIDSGAEEGGEISPFYDPMIAKVIAYGPDRQSAIETLLAGLDETIVSGVKTNRAFLARVLGHQDFRDSLLGTHFIADRAQQLQPPTDVPDRIFAVAALALLQNDMPVQATSPWDALGSWRLNLDASQPIDFGLAGGSIKTLRLTQHGKSYRIDGLAKPMQASVRRRDELSMDVDFDGEMLRAVVIVSPAQVEVRAWGQTFLLIRPDAAADTSIAAGGSGAVRAPMPGRVLDILVKVGERIKAGDIMLTLEAMKMEQRLTAPITGQVKAIHMQKDAQVRDGELLIEIETGDA
jgi:3-methylcrotonyl-CoA carboxylase alpha subunit